jgi:hypothetical protein
MKFCFPSKFPLYRKEIDHMMWWSVWINLPFIFAGTESVFCDVNTVWKIEAPTGFKIERNECWHSFRITFLGFGFGYARQWDY